RGGENLRALLRTVIQRKIANLLRERKRKPGNFGRGDAEPDDGPDHEPPARNADPAEDVLIADAAHEVLTVFAAALRDEPGGDVLTGVFSDMCRARTVEETAAACRRSARTVIRQRDIVIKKLAAFFEENGFEITERSIRAVLRLPPD